MGIIEGAIRHAMAPGGVGHRPPKAGLSWRPSALSYQLSASSQLVQAAGIPAARIYSVLVGVCAPRDKRRKGGNGIARKICEKWVCVPVPGIARRLHHSDTEDSVRAGLGLKPSRSSVVPGGLGDLDRTFSQR
jgi:hypothetical protein